MKLTIGYFYPKLLNLYGDNGNVEILQYRAQARGIDTQIIPVSIGTPLQTLSESEINLVFMGGGPDSSQKNMYADLTQNKAEFLRQYITAGGVGLFICGAYQLIGRYYEAADGSRLDGLGIFDLYTKHFGNHKPRCIGNTLCELNPKITHDLAMNTNNPVGNTLVGFENHGGRTYLGHNVEPFAKVIKGHGNNSEDQTEGALFNNAIGTYFHGPILARNPHFADFLIAKALKTDSLKLLDDNLIITAHTASKKLRQ